MILCLAVSSLGRVVFVTVDIHRIDRLFLNNWIHFGIKSLLNGNGNGIGIGVLHLLRRSALDRGKCKDRRCQISIGGILWGM